MRFSALETSCFIAAAALLQPTPLPVYAQQQVVIVTSFPKELTEAYKKAFEAKNPGIKVEILNKPTSAGVAYIREAPATNKPDVFWVSAPDAFEVLSGEKLLAKIDSPAKEVPAKIGNYPINDPEGLLPRPGARRLRHHVEHALHESQQAARAQRMGRSRQARLFQPRRDVVAVALGHHASDGRNHPARRRLGKRLAPDADDRRQLRRNHRAQLRRARRRQQRPVRHRTRDRLLRPRREGFRLSDRVRLSVGDRDRSRQHRHGRRCQERREREASSSITRSRPKARNCCSILQISRLPVLPGAYKKAPPGFPNPFTGTIKPKVNFDSDLAESRYYVVSSIFDQTITFRHKELTQATKAINEAAAKLAGKHNPQAVKLLDEARDAAYSPVVSGAEIEGQGISRALSQYQARRREDQANHGTRGILGQYRAQKLPARRGTREPGRQPRQISPPRFA